jgi:hypothetical protein
MSLLRMACFEGSNSAFAAVIYVILRFILRDLSRQKPTRKCAEEEVYEALSECSRDGGPGDRCFEGGSE